MDEPTLAASSLETRLAGPLIAVRIDGVAFSTLTKDPVFDAPYDEDFAEAMVEAAIALMGACGPSVMAYTQSDEITAVFDLSRTDWYAGRAFKIATLCASLVSSQFAASLARAGKTPARAIAFDARIVDAGSAGAQIDELIAWRLADAQINSTTTHARAVLGHSAIQGVSTKDMRIACAQAGEPWGELNLRRKFGTFIVRERYMSESFAFRHRWAARQAGPGAATQIATGGRTQVVAESPRHAPDVAP